jgi:hypothetical protein
MRKMWIVAALALAGCGNRAELDQCQSEGARYYREIGSYPELSTGERAEDVIREKCAFNPHMFENMPY